MSSEKIPVKSVEDVKSITIQELMELREKFDVECKLEDLYDERFLNEGCTVCGREGGYSLKSCLLFINVYENCYKTLKKEELRMATKNQRTNETGL